MKIKTTPIDDLVIIEPRVFSDERGFFLETFSEKIFKELGLPVTFVQDNWSRSTKGVLRGLHFQKVPFAQGKLVRVSRGAVWDVAVDLRPQSKTFGEHFGIEVNETNKLAFYVPEGFAHGFVVLSDVADFQYKCTQGYSPSSEGGLVWNDPDLKISWPVEKPVLAAKDLSYPSFRELKKTLLVP